MSALETLEESATSRLFGSSTFDSTDQEGIYEKVLSNQSLMLRTFSFLSEHDLLCRASLVSTSWADAATHAHASLMLISVGCSASFAYSEDPLSDDVKSYDEDIECEPKEECKTFAQSMMRSWDYLVTRFPWGTFLSEGAFKRVYKVWNSFVGAEEAVSVMNLDQIHNVNVVGSELAVSVMLSSLVRRNICPNFVSVRGIFTSEYEPSLSLWGCANNKAPQGEKYDVLRTYKKPRKPSNKKKGSFQYIRMELCSHGDLEEYIKKQPGSVLSPCDSRALLFQMAFSLHVAGNKFGMKHYDVKLLNFFVDDTNEANLDPTKYPYTVLQYGLGSHIFNVRMKTRTAITVKLADFGTSNMRAESNGQPVLISNFTTLENTPPDYLILGDAAVQGYGHDYFGLGLCMLHLFTGYAPYEEIMETVHCPPNLKRKLKSIWESNKPNGYEVIKNVIRCDVLEDDDGNIIEGVPDETLYDTFYRFLVLFGIPTDRFEYKEGSRVWGAIDRCIGVEDVSNFTSRSRRNPSSDRTRKKGPDYEQYMHDCGKFSISRGDNEHIARARNNLERFNGGMDLLLSLVTFDPKKRASPLDVMNSKFMESLREGFGSPEVTDHDIVYSYLSFKTL
jgi:serine/threonine protein kinase